MRLAVFGVLAIALAALPRGAVAEPQISTTTLENGLQVVVIPDRRAPVVTHMVWYKVGAADEPPGKSGIAHYLEHLMFKGTKANPNGRFSEIVAEIGGQENAFTSQDYTAYFQRVAKEHLGLVMSLEADRMENLVLSEAAAKPELQVVLEERASRTDNDPSSQLSEAMDATLYMSHPYRLPIIGWKHEIEGLTYKDAIAFYDRFYTPNNAILIVAGDVEPADVNKMAAEIYGKIKRRAEPGERKRPQEPEPLASRAVTLADPRVTQPSLRIGWVAPSYTTAKPGEAEALDVMMSVLGEGTTSRLYRTIVLDKRLATSAGGWYSSSALDDARVQVSATPRDGVTLDTLRAEMKAVITDLAENGPTEEELARAKRSMVAEMVYAQDSQQSLARIYGVALTTGSTVADVQAWPADIKAVTAEAVKAAARTYLTEARSVTGYLTSAPGAAAGGGQGAGGGKPTAIQLIEDNSIDRVLDAPAMMEGRMP